MAKGITLERNGQLTEAGKAYQASNTRRTDGKKGLNSELYNSANYDSTGTLKPGALEPKALSGFKDQPYNAELFTGKPAPTKIEQPQLPQQPPLAQPQAQNPNAPTVPYEQALAGLQKTTPNASELGMATNALKQMYQGGFQQTTSSGAQAPATWGGATQQIQQTTLPTEQAPSPLTNIVETDNTFDSIFTAYDDYFSPPKQKQSLLQEYKSMSKALGIEDMNEELIDAKRIIEGTEDDIRAEVTAAGGMATESQVLSMANARNKSLIKNYNYLLESRDSAMTQLNTMMNLSVQDRQMAEAEFDRKMNFGFKVAEFKQRAVDNARQQNSALLSAFGAQGMLSILGSNPYELSLFEKSMGMPAGGLAKAAAIPPTEEEQLKLQALRLSVQNQALQNKKLTMDISSTGTTGTLSPYQQEQTTRTLQSVSELRLKALQSPQIFGRSSAIPLPQFLRSDQYRNFRAEIDTLKSSIIKNELQAMREASKTGGALGNVSEREIAFLEASLGALNMSQTPQNFVTQLNKIQDSVNRWNAAKGATAQQVPITAPDGQQVIIVD